MNLAEALNLDAAFSFMEAALHGSFTVHTIDEKQSCERFNLSCPATAFFLPASQTRRFSAVPWALRRMLLEKRPSKAIKRQDRFHHETTEHMTTDNLSTALVPRSPGTQRRMKRVDRAILGKRIHSCGENHGLRTKYM